MVAPPRGSRWGWSLVTKLLYYGRILQLTRAFGTGRRLILAYHRVLPADSPDRSFIQPGMYVTAPTFEAHLRWLSGSFEIVPLDGLLSVRSRNACAITFDDGWRDNYDTAFPLLRQYGVPATVFLATNLVGTARWPWPDRVCFYVHKASVTDFAAAFDEAWREEPNPPFVPAPRSGNGFDVAEYVLRHLKTLEHGVLTRVVGRLDRRFSGLETALHNRRPWLTWDEVLEMSHQGVSFGSHTENHVILTKVPAAEARREITDSRSALSGRLGRPVSAFCYPSGACSPEIARMVAEAGYACAVTTRSGVVHDSAGPYELNRILLHDDISSTRAMLACALAGFTGFRQLSPGAFRRHR